MNDRPKIAPWIQTREGRAFDLDDMTHNCWDEQEVSLSLSRTYRFEGHTIWPYTVAQHSVLVARQFSDPKMRCYGLLHDAAEAFIGDITAPLKSLIRESGSTVIDDIEERICVWILGTHHLATEIPPIVKHEDLRALATEARDIMNPHPRPWCEMPDPWEAKIEPWHPEFARSMWLDEYWNAYGLVQ